MTTKNFIKSLFFKLILISLFLFSVLFAVGQDNNERLYGVWANADCELVQTEKYTLLFERKNDTISATLRQTEQIKGVKYSIFVSGYNFFVSTKKCEKIDKSTLGNSKIRFVDFISLKNNKLQIKRDKNPLVLELVEKINICKPYAMPFSERNTVGECLQNWQLGTVEKNMSKDDFWLEIGTNRHVYVFIENPHQVYCRAARIRHNNQGSVFAQNIRLMVSQSNSNVYMSKNNLEKTKEDIIIDNTLFRPDVCSFEKGGIYWSFISTEQDKIKVNGCGKIYTFERPHINDKKVVEWFKYSQY